MGAASSKSSSPQQDAPPVSRELPLCIKDHPQLQKLEPKQEIAMFGQYLPRQSTTSAHRDVPFDKDIGFNFWICRVATTNKAMDRSEFDALLDCQAGVTTQPKQNPDSLPGSFKLWMIKEYGQRYLIKPPEQKDIDKFHETVAQKGGNYKSSWIPNQNDMTTISEYTKKQEEKKKSLDQEHQPKPKDLPEVLVKYGFQFGPFKSDEQYLEQYHKQMAQVNQVAVSQNGWSAEGLMTWSLYSVLISHFVTLRSMAAFSGGLKDLQTKLKKEGTPFYQK